MVAVTENVPLESNSFNCFYSFACMNVLLACKSVYHNAHSVHGGTTVTEVLLGIEPGSSKRTISTLNYKTISLSPKYILYETTINTAPALTWC